MKKVLYFTAAVAGVSLAHYFFLFAVVLFTFLCTFDAPQGGDVPRTKEEVARARAVKPIIHAAGWVGERAIAVLKLPMTTLDELLPAFRTPWWLNSTIWGCCIVGVWKLRSRIKKGLTMR